MAAVEGGGGRLHVGGSVSMAGHFMGVVGGGVFLLTGGRVGGRVLFR